MFPAAKIDFLRSSIAQKVSSGGPVLSCNLLCGPKHALAARFA
jgi:hypothetical protein